MYRINKINEILMVVIILIITSTLTPILSVAQKNNNKSNQNQRSVYLKNNDYLLYNNQNKQIPLANTEVFLNLTQSISNNLQSEIEPSLYGKENVLKMYEGEGYVEIPLNIEKAGLYNIGFDYYVLQGSKNDPEFKIEIDSKVPFSDASRFVLSRLWEDANNVTTDSRGNQIRPDQKEIYDWQSYIFKDNNGIYNDPYLFNFTCGSHTIRIYLVRSSIAISNMKLFCEKEPITYSIYNEDNKGFNLKGISITYQAEKAYQKSSPVLFPIYDRSSSRTEPNDPAKLLLNTIGSTNWKHQGEWISWKIMIPKDGNYKLSFRVRQNIMRGMNSTRRLLIDGIVPFKEASMIEFPYRTNWYEYTISGNDDPYQFYLTSGVHEIKLETTPGMVGSTLRNVENMVYRLSTLYRKIITITGVNPDINKDYYLEDNIPELLNEFTLLADDMRKEVKYMEAYTKSEGSMASQLSEIARQLDSYVDEPYTIPLRLQSYESNITALGTWLRTLREQPLEIDYFQILSPDKKPVTPNANIFSQIAFGVRAFIASFIVNYDSLGDVYDKGKALEVWVPGGMSSTVGIGSGRDQIDIIKRLIDDKFSKEFNINVNLNLVDSTNTVLQATFAGKGPDAALCLPKAIPIDWAMRGALEDLSKYKNFEKISDQFYSSAFVPFQYQNGTYALPETQSFNMFFYRKDIFTSLGIKPPDTWEEFYNIIPKLHKNNLEIGMPSEYNFNGVTGVSDQIFQSILFQKDKTYYTKDLRATNFDTTEALDAFKKWTGFFSQQGLPLSFAFFNRFRTGEMPCGFADYTMYNMFKVAAPEINNLWEMVPIPGTVKPNGAIDRTTPSNTNGCIIFEKSKKKENAYKLLEWWVSAPTQAQFAKNLESLLGTGARYPTANKYAFVELPWSAKEAASIKAQWAQTWDIPQIPGSYYVNRSLSNAFRKVVYNWQNERETLFDYSKKMNDEILRKRKEFRLEVGTK